MFVIVNNRNFMLVSVFRKRKNLDFYLYRQCFVRPLMLVLFSFHICWNKLGVVKEKKKKQRQKSNSPYEFKIDLCVLFSE